MSATTTTTKEKEIERGKQIFKERKQVVITSGAGWSFSSGIATYRGQNAGNWEEGIKWFNNREERVGPRIFSFADICTARMLEEHPEFSWAFYKYRYDQYMAAEPHAGYFLLLQKLMKKIKEHEGDCFLVTSNIDGLWTKTVLAIEQNMSSEDQKTSVFRSSKQSEKKQTDGELRLWEIHGNAVSRLQCSKGPRVCDVGVWEAREEIQKIQIDEDTGALAKRESIPRCPKCGALARPNVQMFADFAWDPSREKQDAEHFQRFLQAAKVEKEDEENVYPNLLVIEIGCGKGVPTLRLLGEELVQKGAALIRISLEDAVLDSRDLAAHLDRVVLLQGDALTNIEQLFN